MRDNGQSFVAQLLERIRAVITDFIELGRQLSPLFCEARTPDTLVAVIIAVELKGEASLKFSTNWK